MTGLLQVTAHVARTGELIAVLPARLAGSLSTQLRDADEASFMIPFGELDDPAATWAALDPDHRVLVACSYADTQPGEEILWTGLLDHRVRASSKAGIEIGAKPIEKLLGSWCLGWHGFPETATGTAPELANQLVFQPLRQWFPAGVQLAPYGTPRTVTHKSRTLKTAASLMEDLSSTTDPMEWAITWLLDSNLRLSARFNAGLRIGRGLPVDGTAPHRMERVEWTLEDDAEDQSGQSVAYGDRSVDDSFLAASYPGTPAISSDQVLIPRFVRPDTGTVEPAMLASYAAGEWAKTRTAGRKLTAKIPLDGPIRVCRDIGIGDVVTLVANHPDATGLDQEILARLTGWTIEPDQYGQEAAFLVPRLEVV